MEMQCFVDFRSYPSARDFCGTFDSKRRGRKLPSALHRHPLNKCCAANTTTTITTLHLSRMTRFHAGLPALQARALARCIPCNPPSHG